MALELMYGVGLIVAMCAMVWIGRPSKGVDSAPWLRIYIVGQLYVMSAMLCGIVGGLIGVAIWYFKVRNRSPHD